MPIVTKAVPDLTKAVLTAIIISIDPIANGKHIGRSQLIEVAPQHLCEKTAHA